MKKFLLSTIIILLFFQPYLQILIPIFSYLDEAMCLLFIPGLLYYIKKKNGIISLKKDDQSLLLCLICILALGLTSNIIFNIQNIKYVFGDILVFFKFFIFYSFIRMLFDENSLNRKLLQVLILFLFFGTIYDYIFHVNLTPYIRFGLQSNYFIFGNPLGLVSISSVIFCLYSLSSKKVDIFSAMLIIVILSTLRFKAIIFILFIISFYFYIKNSNKKINVSRFFVLGIVAFIIVYNQINYYFVESVDTTARGQLLNKSIIIAKDYFPLGTGFGTYASYMSGVNYSSLYYKYKLSNIWGLSPNFNSYLSDSFWPMIIGQFGFLGFFLFGMIIINLFKKIQNKYNSNRKFGYYSRVLGLVYLLLSSLTESAFVNPVCIGFAIVLGIGGTSDEE